MTSRGVRRVLLGAVLRTTWRKPTEEVMKVMNTTSTRSLLMITRILVTEVATAMEVARDRMILEVREGLGEAERQGHTAHVTKDAILLVPAVVLAGLVVTRTLDWTFRERETCHLYALLLRDY